MKTASSTTSIPGSFTRADIILALGDIVRRDYPQYGSLRFAALPPDLSLFDTPTFAVEVYKDQIKAGTYKFNVMEDVSMPATGLCPVFSPLVIQWTDGGAYKVAGMDKCMIGHCLMVIRRLLQKNNFGYSDAALLTTAYLTKQRAGKKFFSAAGWHIIEFDKKDFGGQAPDLPAPYAALADRIDCLSAPHRTSADEADHVCFGYVWIFG